MKKLTRTTCTLAALLAAHFSSHAAATVFQGAFPPIQPTDPDPHAAFTAAAGFLPVINFDSITPGTDLAGTSIRGDDLHERERQQTRSGGCVTHFYPRRLCSSLCNSFYNARTIANVSCSRVLGSLAVRRGNLPPIKM